MSSQRLSEVFNDIREFDEILDGAERRARNGPEISFIADIRERYDWYREDTYLTVKQLEWIRSIAGAGDTGC